MSEGFFSNLFLRLSGPTGRNAAAVQKILAEGPLRGAPDGGAAAFAAMADALTLARAAFPWTHPTFDASVEVDSVAVSAKVRVSPNVALRIAAHHGVGSAVHVKLIDRRTRETRHEDVSAGRKDLIGCLSAIAGEWGRMDLDDSDKFIPVKTGTPFDVGGHALAAGTGTWANPCGTALLVAGEWRFPDDPMLLADAFRRGDLIVAGDRTSSDPSGGI